MTNLLGQHTAYVANLDPQVCMINVLQVDLAGFVIWCGSLEFVGRTLKCNQGYKMDLNFIDEEVDLAGFVIWCGSLEFVGRTSKCNQGYKMDLNFIDEEFNEFISKMTALEYVMAVIQHVKCKEM
ncbi:hypothetical protein HanHA89_Chr05g0198671 [Helianthus annuus]|nr:hypothetical protein HanHA89_Chr05g0198671 [Helianthus annuus]